MLTAVSGKVESIIPFVSKCVIMYICFKIYTFQYLLNRFTNLSGIYVTSGNV